MAKNIKPAFSKEEKTSANEALPIEQPLLRRDWIAGLEKGLELLRCFDEEHSRVSASEMALLTGMTRTATRRYLLTLAHLGYLGTDGKLFWLTPRVLQFSQAYLASSRLVRVAQPFLQRIDHYSEHHITCPLNWGAPAASRSPYSGVWRGGALYIGGQMTSTVQDRAFPTDVPAVNPDSDAAEGNRRGQGWLIAIGASAVLWTGIIVAIVGIMGLGK